ncbi:hypothetical protein FTUN_3559 [Frigoriglobus tundricola]|uniref:Uncharacterized protein n=1 Tax=Frigoriglobus tundricola TaxID=2774151 RepID=A0A6M5YPT8_9BACT|nr:hypothetical protein FTUN_3559 [Frigoriglobus tundricola]
MTVNLPFTKSRCYALVRLNARSLFRAGKSLCRGRRVAVASGFPLGVSSRDRGRTRGRHREGTLMALAHSPDGTPPHSPVAAPGHDRGLAPYRPVAPPTAELAVVVVNYCQWKNTARLVRQLRRSAAVRTGAAEVRVVDNASPAHRLAARVAGLRGVSVRRFDHNLVRRGRQPRVPAHRRAVGAAAEPGRHRPGRLPRRRARRGRPRRRHPRRGRDRVPAAQPRRHPSAVGRAVPDVRSHAGRPVRPRARRKCRTNRGGTRRAVEWATGGCLLVRRECFEQLRRPRRVVLPLLRRCRFLPPGGGGRVAGLVRSGPGSHAPLAPARPPRAAAAAAHHAARAPDLRPPALARLAGAGAVRGGVGGSRGAAGVGRRARRGRRRPVLRPPP